MEALTWASLAAAGGSLVALIKFWMDLGAMSEKAKVAEHNSGVLTAKHELLSAQLADFKVTVAQNYATTRALADTENALLSAVNGVNNRLDGLTSRIDDLIILHRNNGKN